MRLWNVILGASCQFRKHQEETLEHNVHALCDVSFFYQTPPHSISICIDLLWFDSTSVTKAQSALTCQSVIHIKTKTLDLLHGQAPVDKHPETGEQGTVKHCTLEVKLYSYLGLRKFKRIRSMGGKRTREQH